MREGELELELALAGGCFVRFARFEREGDERGEREMKDKSGARIKKKEGKEEGKGTICGA